jgi:hypothetical protein
MKMCSGLSTSNNSYRSKDMEQSKGNTGTRDVTFNLVSIMYHALQGAETIEKYVGDADQGGGNEELTQFFQETKDEYGRLADRAKELLTREMSNSRSAAG